MKNSNTGSSHAASAAGAPRDGHDGNHESVGWVDRLATRYVAWVERRTALVLWLALFLCIPATYATARLFMNLRASFEELMPDTAPSVVGLRAIRARVGDASQLTLVLTGPEGSGPTIRPKLISLANDLARELRKEAVGLVRAVDYQVNVERAFFKRYGWIYFDLEELTQIRDNLRERVDYERKKRNPLYIDLSGDEAPKKLDVRAMVKKRAVGAFDFDRFKDGYFTSPDGDILAMVVRMPRGVSGHGNAMKLLTAAKAILARLNPQSYDSRIVVGFSGDVASTIEETASLQEDIILSTVLVFLLCGFVVIFYFRRARSVYLLGLPLLVGVLFTFAVAYLAIGYLNSNTAFLASIVVGNGVNFGIILLARFADLRDRPENQGLAKLPELMATSLSHTAAATFTAAGAASIAYGSLVITEFRGFNQFGFIGGVGMILCWLTSFTVMPALILAVERRSFARHAGKPLPPHKPNPRRIATAMGRLVVSSPRFFSTLSLLAVAVAAVLSWQYFKDPFEYDGLKLRSKSSFKTGAGWWAKRVDRVFGRYLTPTVVLAKDLDHAEKIAAVIKKQIDAEQPRTVVNNVEVAGRVIPPPPALQLPKLELIGEIRKILTKEIRPYLTEEEKTQVADYTPPEDLKLIGAEDLPRSIQDRVVQPKGDTSTAVLVFPKFKANMWNVKTGREFEMTIRNAEKRSGESWIIGGYPLLFNDMLRAVERDGPRSTFLSLIGVVLLCFVTFAGSGLRHGAVVAVTLCCGVLLMAAALALMGVRLNFLNFIAFPITFGIGVDYGVNVYRRYLVEGPGRLVDVVKSAGGAVALCSATTVIGYSALLIADNQGLVSFGVAANLGELTCLALAVFGLPAVLRVVEIWRKVPGEARPASTPPTDEPVAKPVRGGGDGGGSGSSIRVSEGPELRAGEGGSAGSIAEKSSASRNGAANGHNLRR